MESGDRYRFGLYELDLASHELRRRGRRLEITPQAMTALCVLVEHAGAVVDRDTFKQRLWGEGTHVEFDQGLNSIIRQVRQALDDRAENPRFIDTVPRRGYRFIAPLERILPDREPLATRESETRVPPEIHEEPSPTAVSRPAAVLAVVTRRWRWWVGAALIVFAVTMIAGPRGEAPRSAPPTLAVLPFSDLSAGTVEAAYVADGLTTELISQLARLAPTRLAVIAVGSARAAETDAYDSDADDPVQQGHRLGATWVLDGRVHTNATRVRVIATLYHPVDAARAGQVVWSESWDRRRGDLAEIQRELAGRVVEALALELLPSERFGAATVDAEAWDAYLRGRYFLARYDADGYRAARRAFDEALEITPDFAAAHAGIAEAWVLSAWADVPVVEAMAAARVAVRRALEIEPDHALAHRVEGIVRLYHDWDPRSAQKAFERALMAAPGDAESHHWTAGAFSAAGAHDRAIEHDDLARRLDPLSLTVRSDRCWYLFFARRLDEAAAACEDTLELEPDHRFALRGKLEIAQRRGDRAAGVAAATRLLATDRSPFDRDQPMLERFRERDHAWRLAEAEDGRGDAISAAMTLAAVGEVDLALDWLERAVDQRDPWCVFIDVDPRLDPLRHHDRFSRVRARIFAGGELPD
ncbi:MAG: winged helix-turn-helix domain-containing protein [Acidobacteriota bacterium]